MATLGHRAVAVHSEMSCIFSLCLFPVSPCRSLQLFPFSCSLCSPQKTEESVSLCFFISPSLCGLVYPSLLLSLFCLLYVSPYLSLSVNRQSESGGKLAVPSLMWSCQTYQSCVPAYLAVSDDESLSKGTESSFVMQGIPPVFVFTSCIKPLVRQRSHSLRFQHSTGFRSAVLAF